MIASLKRTRLEVDAAEALRRCLARVPFVRIREQKTLEAPDGPDLVARLKLPKSERTLVAEVKASGQPRIVRETVARMKNYLGRFKNAYGVFIAPFVSQRTAAICEEAGIGYVDLAGNCRLCFDQVYIRETAPGNPYTEKRELRSLYSPKAARILRVMLISPRQYWRMQALASEAGVSLGQTANAKKLLEDHEWLSSTREGIRLAEPETVLLEWSVNQQRRRDRTWLCYTMEPRPEIEARLAETCAERRMRLALTEFSAGARLAPMVRAPRASAYVLGDVPPLLDALGIKAVESGANLALIEPRDEGVFYGSRPIDNIETVSAVQAFLDLKGLGARGDEAAEAILQEVLRDRW